MLCQNNNWHIAYTWVRSHPVLVRAIAAPYRKYMACDQEDLENEAILAAYQVFSMLTVKKLPLTLMDRYFRITFKARCIALAAGIKTVECDINRIPVSQTGTATREPDGHAIQESLNVLTGKQRRVVSWILDQPIPVSAADAARQFEVTTRAIYALIKNAIWRIENEHRTVCQRVQAAA